MDPVRLVVGAKPVLNLVGSEAQLTAWLSYSGSFLRAQPLPWSRNLKSRTNALVSDDASWR